MEFKTVNPATGQPLLTYAALEDDALEARLEQAAAAWASWRTTPIDKRAEYLRELARLLRDRSARYGELMTTEMGKPLDQAKAEVEKCATACDYYAEHGADFLADEQVEAGDRTSLITYQPIGTVFAIMPWNFPFWQVIRFAAPTLLAGNVGVLKHAPSVLGCAEALEGLFAEAGFPEAVFTSVIITHEQAERVITHPSVAAVTLTGSTRAGKQVAALAGSHIKKTVLELGGSDPYVVLADADLDAAVNACMTGRFINSGQSCIAAKRLIVVDDIRDAYRERIKAHIDAMTWGDPMESPDIGPMARGDLRNTLHDQVTRSIAAGAACLAGGEIPDGPGYFYPPTLLEHVVPGMPAYDEEMFGPVACLIEARDEDDAIRIANDTSYGLGAAVFTADAERGREIARTAISAGACFVNTFVASDPRLPFGGIRESGYGRELSRHGIMEFVNTKTVVVS